MKNETNYIKVATYEAKEPVKRCLLLYSGGLDTSVMLKWLGDTYGTEVVTLTLDLGQQNDDLKAIQEKALKLGAKNAITLDVKNEFAEQFIAKGIKANATYQGDYHLSTPIGRALIAKKAVEIAAKEGAECIAHGCTGKGNDQVRLDGYVTTLNSKLKVIAPVREWNMDRNEEIQYAKANGIPVPTSVESPYSVDDNMWGMTWEGGEIEDPSLIAPVERFLTTYTRPEKAPNTPEDVKLTFEEGLPVALNGKKMALAALIMELNTLGGKHGVGVAHVLEDRLVGLKNRGIYEQPAGHIIVTAHQYLERSVNTRQLNEIKEYIDTKWAYLCYGAQWFDPAMSALNAFCHDVNKRVTGEVTVRLFKGHSHIVASTSPFALHFASFNRGEGYSFNVNASAGFTEVYSLQMRLSNSLG